MKKSTVIWLALAVALGMLVPEKEEAASVSDLLGSFEEYLPDVASPEIITSGEYAYWINDDKETITISNYIGDEEVIAIPSEIDGYQVSAIGAEAFMYREMKSLSFPEGIRSIGNRAFEYCTVSETVEFPENVTFGPNTFGYAQLPAALKIPSGATVTGCAFNYCDTIEQVEVGSNAVIEGRAFGYCDNLKEVICEDGSLIEEDAFEYCRDLETVTLGEGVKLDEEAFPYCGDFKLIRSGVSETDPGSPVLTPPDEGPLQTEDMPDGLSGGWEIAEDPTVTEEAGEIFEQAVSAVDDVIYEPVALLATQVVAGMNYCFLGREIPLEGSGNSWYSLIYIWQAPGRPAQLLETQRLEFGLSPQAETEAPDFGEQPVSTTGQASTEQPETFSGQSEPSTGETASSTDISLPPGEHRITLKDSEYLITDCPKTAMAGDMVMVYTMDVADGEVKIEVNGADIGSWLMEGYTFVMPDEDVEIHAWISTEGYPGA